MSVSAQTKLSCVFVMVCVCVCVCVCLRMSSLCPVIPTIPGIGGIMQIVTGSRQWRKVALAGIPNSLGEARDGGWGGGGGVVAGRCLM